MFDSVLIANRGEIAVRVIRACRELAVRSVAVFSEADRGAPHARFADEAHLVGPPPARESYLNGERILEVALQAGVDAVHPGYGFLSENADFARECEARGFVFIGPGSAAIARMGNKLLAREVALNAGVDVVPGTNGPIDDPEAAIAFADEHGYPIAVKATFGGGGRGMKVVWSANAMAEAIGSAQREAIASFGRADCHIERYLTRARHVEVQLLADLDGKTIHLGDRDCTLQRRHQKLVEEAPAPGISAEVRTVMSKAAVTIAREIGYVNAGTCEFLLADDNRTFFFLEMNTRLQVEHPVTEFITGVDLVHKQLQIASGEGMHLTQPEVTVSGHAIEVRINAEDPSSDFLPSSGVIRELRVPRGPWVRFDSGAEAGYEVPLAYDSMIGKLIVWGEDRDSARRRMIRALGELIVTGVPTTAAFHKLAMQHEDFVAGTHSTLSVESEWDLSSIPPFETDRGTRNGAAADPRTPDRPHAVRKVVLTISGQPMHVAVYGEHASDTALGSATRSVPTHIPTDPRYAEPDIPQILAPMQGTIIKYAVRPGDAVRAGDMVCVIEAMKMEIQVLAPRDGMVTSTPYAVGDVVDRGVALASIESP